MEITINNILYDGHQIWIPPNSFTPLNLEQFRGKRIYIDTIGTFLVRPDSRTIYTDRDTDAILINMMSYLKHKNPLRISIIAESSTRPQVSSAFKARRRK